MKHDIEILIAGLCIDDYNNVVAIYFVELGSIYDKYNFNDIHINYMNISDFKDYIRSLQESLIFNVKLDYFNLEDNVLKLTYPIDYFSKPYIEIDFKCIDKVFNTEEDCIAYCKKVYNFLVPIYYENDSQNIEDIFKKHLSDYIYLRLLNDKNNSYDLRTGLCNKD